MATNDFLSQFKLKHLSQLIWFNLIHVLLLLIVIVGLGFFFLIIVMNIQINKISSIYFLLENVHLFIFLTLHPQLPHFFLGLHARGCCSTFSTPISRSIRLYCILLGAWLLVIMLFFFINIFVIYIYIFLQKYTVNQLS